EPPHVRFVRSPGAARIELAVPFSVGGASHGSIGGIGSEIALALKGDGPGRRSRPAAQRAGPAAPVDAALIVIADELVGVVAVLAPQVSGGDADAAKATKRHVVAGARAPTGQVVARRVADGLARSPGDLLHPKAAHRLRIAQSLRGEPRALGRGFEHAARVIGKKLLQRTLERAAAGDW